MTCGEWWEVSWQHIFWVARTINLGEVLRNVKEIIKNRFGMLSSSSELPGYKDMMEKVPRKIMNFTMLQKQEQVSKCY